jgi:prepilin-type N-terminal cleavage/methylation domain-containing protein
MPNQALNPVLEPVGRALRRGRAFTLIEVLIVVVILGILAAVVVGSVYSASQESAQTVTKSELAKVRRHVEAYRASFSNQLPSVTDGDGTWGPLVSANFMTRAPSNPWVGGVNAQRVVLRATPDAGFTDQYGWIFDPASGQVWAASFDASGNPFARP